MQPNADGKDPLNRSLDHLLRSLKSAGPFKFFGIFPQIKIFFLLTPSVMVPWIILEQIQKVEESIGSKCFRERNSQ